MKTQKYITFNFKKQISLIIIPFISYDFENYYKYYNHFITLGWLCFCIEFEFVINKKEK